MQINEMIEAVQKKLRVQIDGKAGAETWGAIYAEIVKPTIGGREPSLAISKVDARSETYIATLLPEVQPLARALVQKAAANVELMGPGSIVFVLLRKYEPDPFYSSELYEIVGGRT